MLSTRLNRKNFWQKRLVFRKNQQRSNKTQSRNRRPTRLPSSNQIFVYFVYFVDRFLCPVKNDPRNTRNTRNNTNHHISMKTILPLVFTVFISTFISTNTLGGGQQPAGPSTPDEKHLRNIKQLTFGGENAEAYFSADGKQLILQSTREGHPCDQIYTMNIDGSNVRMISPGEGRTTCAYFLPKSNRALYSSTHLGGKA